MTLTLAYFVLVIIGTGYILVTALLGHLTDFIGDAHGAGGASGHEGGSYGVDGSGHGMASAGDAGALHFDFPFFSPLAIATLFTSIGAYGLIAKHGFQVDNIPSLIIALPAAFATAYGITYTAYRIVNSSRASSTLSTQQFVGAGGEVVTPIPANGIGEVAAIVDGQRFTASARSVDGSPLGRGQIVIVIRLQGSTLVVKPEAAAARG